MIPSSRAALAFLLALLTLTLAEDKKASMEERLYCPTPLIESFPLRKRAGLPVYLKLENTHPTSSFKQRGMSYRCKQVYKQGYRDVVSASGGNAGIALAYCARKLGMKCTIVILEGTSERVICTLKEQNAEIKAVKGTCWDDGDAIARKIAAETGAHYIHPFDHPDIWDANSTIIEEVAADLKFKPSVVVTCVGGGGLLCGLIRGMQKIGWNDVPIVAMETEGAASFNASVKAGKLITLSKITSIALTLGAARVCSILMDYINIQPVISELVSDSDAVFSCIKFANEHRILVEPSCGAALAAIYKGILPRLIEEGKINRQGPALVIVCGGNGVDLDMLQQWKEQFSI